MNKPKRKPKLVHTSSPTKHCGTCWHICSGHTRLKGRCELHDRNVHYPSHKCCKDWADRWIKQP